MGTGSLTHVPMSPTRAGVSMAVVGMIMQMLARNRFVEPSTAGTVESATLGILFVMLVVPGVSVVGKMLVATAFALAGTLLAFSLFAYGQSRVPADIAGAFVNLEPVVGAAAGWLLLGESAAIGQVAGATAVLLGIALSTVPGNTGVPGCRPLAAGH